MVFPFGVSVSDFVYGIKLFKNSIDALSDTRGARADFAELSRSLDSLERALKALGGVKLDTNQHQEALKQNLDACRLCLSTFLADIAKYEKLDPQYVTKARLVTSFRQVEWALCKQDDVMKFRSDIEAHVAALEMLLITFQVESTMRAEGRMKKVENTTNDILSKTRQYAHEQAISIQRVKEIGHSQVKYMSDISQEMELCALEVKEQRNELREFQDRLKAGLSPDEQRAMFALLQETIRQNEHLSQGMQALQTQNSTLLQHVLSVKDFLRTQRSLPSQVLLQQPVVLHDALGRIAPFHLEFIDSVVAFLAVLQIRFGHVGRAKVSRLEFDLRDSTRQSQIALRKSWNGVFHPGQHVDMSMLFSLSIEQDCCPGCSSQANKSFKEGELVHCHNCSITYRYGLGLSNGRIHLLEDDGINDLPTPEEGECEVSDFCRVSIIPPESPPSVDIAKPNSSGRERIGAGTEEKAPLLWYCENCRAANSGTLSPDMCSICGSYR